MDMGQEDNIVDTPSLAPKTNGIDCFVMAPGAHVGLVYLLPLL